jgi:regulator of PEP synthase PpsR (kinase-PPPase family)
MIRSGLGGSVFSGVDRARRRQQSEAGLSSAPRVATPSWSLPLRRLSPLGGGDTATGLEPLSRADVVVLGVPGIGKAAVCEFLARHGLKAANIELERGALTLPEPVKRARGLLVGLMMRPDRLIAERRMRSAAQPDRSADIDPQAVRDELLAARRLLNAANCHIIDMSHQSAAAVAARIVALLQRRDGDRRR